MTVHNPGNRPVSVENPHASTDHRGQDEVNSPQQPFHGSAQEQPAKPLPGNVILPRSPLIGRQQEVAAVQHLLLQEAVGLLTLTGPGGIGKTRLALQAAANLLDHFVDGVYFVSLAPVSDPDLVAVTIAQTLGVHEAVGRPLQESLQDYLAAKQLLLVLDNFEQILAAAPLVSGLLSTCQRIKVLVTSRATLHLYGEQEFPVSPLAVPDAKRLPTLAQDSVARLSEFAAIELFCQRARAVQPDFALTPANAADVARICIGLDGLPLAIELAAARIKLFSPAALLARLNQRLTLLTGGPHDLPSRQRTLRDEIAWSYDLLNPAEQTLFRRLAVFVGGFTLEAAQAVGNAAGDLGINVLEGIATLVDHNLLKRLEQSGVEPRFGMLETIHEYALEQLAASGEGEAIRRQHVSFFLTLAEEADPKLRSSEQLAWLQRLEVDDANLRAALTWSLGDGGKADHHTKEQGLRLIGALHWYWYLQTRYNEARSWGDRALALSDSAEQGPIRARVLQTAGLAAQMQGDFAYARRRFEESLALWRALGDKQGIVFTLAWLAAAVSMLRDFATACLFAEESVLLGREMEDKWNLALALDMLGATHNDMGNHATARPLIEESLALFRFLGDRWGITDVLSSLSVMALKHGDYTAARAWLEEGLAISQPWEDRWFLQGAYYFLGVIERQQGNDEQAVTLFEQSLTLAQEMGAKWSIPGACLQLGFSRLRQGDDRQAARYFYESLENFAQIEGSRPQGFILVFAGLSAVAARQQQWERAARLSGAAEGLCRKLDLLLEPGDRADYDHYTAIVRARCHEPQVAAAWAAGQTLSLEQAIEYALALPDLPGSAPPPVRQEPVAPTLPSYPAGLSAREVEVLRLLVEGLTYAQIADRLVISRRTVNAHVTSIYGKLDVTSRATATRFALENNLI